MFLILDDIDRRIDGWMERYGHLILRVSLASFSRGSAPCATNPPRSNSSKL
ncbi:MAG: hypothetical protein QGH25_11615 [Candidatus Latescibacteria bacterium]|jgi:hypothetical protein|nr:hypothetical protein [Candidatus Latescibacterota bacterium]